MSKFQQRWKTPSLSKWQVWRAYVSYEGNEGGKKRPVLVTGIRGSECSIMEISSQPARCVTDILIEDLYSAGLDRDSVIQVRKKRTIRKDSLKEYLGVLSDKDIHQVEANRGWFP